MKVTTSVTDLMRNFADYVNRVAYRGEHFVIVRGGKPVAELSPTPPVSRLRDLPDLLHSLPPLTEAEVDAWARDLNRFRAELGAALPASPWES